MEAVAGRESTGGSLQTAQQLVVNRVGDDTRQVVLITKLYEEDATSPTRAPYTGEIAELAQVEFPKEAGLQPEVMDQAAAWFATNILVGQTRAHIELITGAGPYPKVMLSPINAVAVISNGVVGTGKGTQPLHPTPPDSVVGSVVR